jgi:A/G-specific adenine glycosylase
VEQGISYYHRFINKFPDVDTLANADLDDVLKQWQGLGYYNRARNMHYTAQFIVQKHESKLPETYNELVNLKGIGPYTAAAIASFAFNKPSAVVDGNVKRVIARIYGIKEPINSSKGEDTIKEIANQILDKNNPGEHNQALIEFGALQCIPQNPECDSCPLAENCLAYHNNMVHQIPVKSAPKKKKNRYFYYLIINHNNNQHIFINRRTKKDVWNSLYEFPLIERKEKNRITTLTQSQEWKLFFANNMPNITYISEEYKHILSHQNIFATFIEIKTKEPTDYLKKNFISIDKDNLENYAVSRLIDRYLENG